MVSHSIQPISWSCVSLQLIKDMQSAPTEIDLMKDTIDILTNSSAPSDEVLLALEALQALVEPIDNANGERLCGVFLSL